MDQKSQRSDDKEGCWSTTDLRNVSPSRPLPPFVQELGDTEEQLTQRTVVVFAHGQIERPAWGPGTRARIAALHVQGRAKNSDGLVHHSITSSTFKAVIDEMVKSDAFLVCTPRRFYPVWRMSR
jgi:hypothetical protein